ncbi:phosphatidylserine decarboxylase protein [Rutstroemia sp. NJR-2017a BVV2]|nr:phosphatidylserine decarboxylase protein [Rutstroemia sp. NJR-2017a BVV2]
MNHLLARKKSSSSFRGKQSEAGSAAPSSTTPSNQKPREAKSAPYTHPSYTTLLATKGSFLDESDLGITGASKNICRILLEKEQTVSQDSLFRDDVFNKACRKIQDRNEVRVVQDITRLIVPSAETLATYSTTYLDPLIESINKGWNSVIPFYSPRPQPDYSVGFGRSAFTDDQLEKLRPFVSKTYEVKYSTAALDIADRQNTHSIILAVRGIVELFRLMKREKELHREILAFSVSYDHRTVRIYSHYPVIDRKKTTFYHHPIHKFSFTALDSKEKWTVYKFTKNIYDIWMPIYLKRIYSVIDNLPPDLDFEIS